MITSSAIDQQRSGFTSLALLTVCDKNRGVDVFKFLFVCVEASRPSQNIFSDVGTEPPLPGYFQYFQGVNCLAQGGRFRTCVKVEKHIRIGVAIPWHPI